jgi:cobalt/nickel transport system permease protein
VIQETFASGDSLIHRIDPRFRLGAALVLSFTTALSNHFLTLTLALMVSLFLIPLARLNAQAVIRRMVVVWGFLIFIWIMLPLTFGGEELLRIGPMHLSLGGIFLAGRITLKSFAILFFFIALVSTLDFATLGYALQSFRVPAKLIHLLLLTYRYVFVIEQEYLKLLRAAKIRCFRPGTNLHTYKTYAYLVGMLFIRASDRAGRVYHAMRCRGFKGKFYCLREFSVSRKDWIWAAVMLICVLGLAAVELTKTSWPGLV